jgi:hypothetical protein
MQLRAKRMKGLRINETSGVDMPAHLSDGWMVLKSAGGGGDPLDDLTDEQIESLIKAAEAEEEKPVKELIESLTKALGSMPDAAKAQATALIGALGGEPATGAVSDPVAKAVADALKKAQSDQEAAEARATAAEAELAKAKGTATETEEEALAKAMATLPEAVRKHLEAQQAEVAKAKTDAAEAAETAKVEKEARLSAEYLTKAKGPDFAGLPGQPETFATALREIDEKLSKEAGAEVLRLLKAASHLNTGGADDFRTFGGMGADVSSTNAAKATIDQEAAKFMAADNTLSPAQAIVKAYDAHPDLAATAMGGEG